MKIMLVLTFILGIFTTQTFAQEISDGDVLVKIFRCNNDSNENQSWVTEPGDSANSWDTARAICRMQGGRGSTITVLHP